MSTYTAFEAEFLVASYLTTEQSGETVVNVSDIFERFPLEAKPNWIMRALSSFEDSGFTRGGMHMGPEMDQHVYLSAYGIKEAERLLDNGIVNIVAPTDNARQQGIPASDRIVSLNHNLPDHKKILQELGDIAEAVRVSNDLPIEPDERDRIISSLSAAETLWSAAQLKVLQIKVGILMAAEDAAKALASTTKAVAAALLVDAIKAFIKTHTSVDLDQM